MIFTKEDFKKIEQYLKKNSYKDSDFSTIETVTGNDKIPIVHYEGEGNTAENVLMAISTIAEYALQNAIPLLEKEIIAFISEYISTPSYGAPLTHIHHFSHDTDEPEGTLHGATFTATSDNVAFNFDCLMKDSDSDEISRTTHNEALPVASTSQAGIINKATFDTIQNTATSLNQLKQQVNQSINVSKLTLTNPSTRTGLNDRGSIIFGDNAIEPGIYKVDDGTIHAEGDSQYDVGMLYYYKRTAGGIDHYWLTFITTLLRSAGDGFIGDCSDNVTRIYSTHSLEENHFTSWTLTTIPTINLDTLYLGGTSVYNDFGIFYVRAALGARTDSPIIGTLLQTETSQLSTGHQQQMFQTNYVLTNGEFVYDANDVAIKTYIREFNGTDWNDWHMPLNERNIHKYTEVPAYIKANDTSTVVFIPYNYEEIIHSPEFDDRECVELNGRLPDGTYVRVVKTPSPVIEFNNYAGSRILIDNVDWRTTGQMACTVVTDSNNNPTDLTQYTTQENILNYVSQTYVNDDSLERTLSNYVTNDNLIQQVIDDDEFYDYISDRISLIEAENAISEMFTSIKRCKFEDLTEGGSPTYSLSLDLSNAFSLVGLPEFSGVVSYYNKWVLLMKNRQALDIKAVDGSTTYTIKYEYISQAAPSQRDMITITDGIHTYYVVDVNDDVQEHNVVRVVFTASSTYLSL